MVHINRKPPVYNYYSQTNLSFSAAYLARKYQLNPAQAVFYANLMGLKGANDEN